MRILDIPQENRPRERFLRGGADGLSEAELLAIILQKGTLGENAVDMSNRIIATYGLERLAGLSIRELQAIKGVGPAKAMQIKAVFELNKRVKRGHTQISLKTAKKVYTYMAPKFSGLDREHIAVLHLNSKNRLIKEEIVAVGLLDVSIVHPREIFKTAIKESSAAIILAHNHPSGDPSPSSEDLEITHCLYEAGMTLGIPVLDHVIIGKDIYWSWNETHPHK